jgi:hypothetical protein
VESPEDISRGLKAAVSRLGEEAKRLKELCEIQALKENVVELSVDKLQLLEAARLADLRRQDFADLREMIHFLRLYSLE